eukprot:TRINITY_DN7706_c0_g1_i1.p1 TRINITY_DN7706_c0_g1~~TRINITY_DN7706_c0_g1_i1.p1  ORF type:complete len:112 (+),score=9.98 TRINITY_DN7706_c0_g1_i1:43-378(+)
MDIIYSIVPGFLISIWIGIGLFIRSLHTPSDWIGNRLLNYVNLSLCILITTPLFGYLVSESWVGGIFSAVIGVGSLVGRFSKAKLSEVIIVTTGSHFVLSYCLPMLLSTLK